MCAPKSSSAVYSWLIVDPMKQVYMYLMKKGMLKHVPSNSFIKLLSILLSELYNAIDEASGVKKCAIFCIVYVYLILVHLI